MEIDITSFVNECDAFQFSASAAELGQDAGKITWSNAVEEGTNSPLLTTPEQIEALRDYMRNMGAWDDDEIAAWDDAECNALFIQYISGNLREIEGLCTDDDTGEINWAKVEELESEGDISGGIYPASDGRFYFYLGH